MQNTKRTILIAVLIIVVGVGVVFGGIFAVSQFLSADLPAAQPESSTAADISKTSAPQSSTSRVTTVTTHTVQYGDESLFNESAKNNILTPEEAKQRGASGGAQGNASGSTAQGNTQSGSGSAASGGAAGTQNGGTTTKKAAASAPYGLSSNDKSAVLAYYKMVSAKNANKQFHKTLTLVSMNGGATVSEKWVERFRGIAEKGLAANNIDNEPYPGKPAQIQASDWQSATASDDGKYTTLTIHVVPQTDDAYGTQFGGPCGRSMGVLDGIGRALQDLPLVSVDSGMNMRISYVNPVIRLKVNDQTGELVSGGCSWSYRTQVQIISMTGKALGVNIRLENASGTIDYKVSY